MDTATLKQVLAIASLATIVLLQASGAPTKPCYLGQYKHLKDKEGAARALRNKYEELRFAQTEPWESCLGGHLEPQWKLDGLTKWERLEAVEMEVSLAVDTLQNSSAPDVAKDASRVLQILTPLQEELVLCMRYKPAGHKASGRFPAFREDFQNFNSSNTAQSPQCLEAAVGLNMIQLLQDVHQVSREQYSHHRHHHHRLSTN